MTKKPPLPPPHKKSAPPPAGRTEPKKTFRVEGWDGSNEGEKIILYAGTGMGKTTLASMLPIPVFLGLDDGGRKIKNPKTGEVLKRIPGVETYQDVRNALAQQGLFDSDKSIVIDTATILQDLAEEWMFANIKTDKGKFVNRITDYGWGAGYRHLYDTMHHILADLDHHIRKGRNIVLVCQLQQVPISSSGGPEYLKDVPQLQDKYGKVSPAIWGMYAQWADHIFLIGHEDVSVSDGRATSSGKRVIHVHPEIHFEAKSRSIPCKYPLLTFDSPDDDTVWQYLFNEVWKREK